VAADPPTLAVVGHQDHGRVVQLASCLEEGEELAHAPVGLGELVEVLRATDPAHVTELVGREQLEHQQVRVVSVDHSACLGGQRMVDFGSRLHRRYGTDHFFAKRVEQVSDPDEPTATTVALEHVEHRLSAHPEPRREVRAHAVLGRGRAGEHRREAHDRPRRIGRLDRQVLSALPGDPVHDRSIRLPEPPPVAPVDNDHVNPPSERRKRTARSRGGGAGRCRPKAARSRAGGAGRCRARAARDREGGARRRGASLAAHGRSAFRIARQALRERAVRQCPAGGRDPEGGSQAADRRSGRLLGQQCRRAQGDQQLRDLLEGVSARRVGVRQDQAPEAEAVGPGRARAQVVIDGSPHDHREERIARQRARQERRRPPRLEQRHGDERGEPQEGAPAQRECEARQHERRPGRCQQRQPKRSVGCQPDRGRGDKDQQRVEDRERPALVDDIPGPGRPDLGEAGWVVILAGHSRHRIRGP
jgi:hypothetical protein